ncbi:MAG: FIST C-terminal domain-containing protein [Alphaproteobacteria bacterium]|nr:FIST C-terminal domain-containing protein [Alphaproteobacteria bacterium]
MRWESWPHGKCGIHVATSRANTTKEAVAELRANLPAAVFAHLIVFFSPRFAPGEVAVAMSGAFPDAEFSGCTSAGEISPQGICTGSIQIMAFEKSRFRFVSTVIDNAASTGVEGASQIARRLKSQFADQCNASNKFALLLTDGLSNHEETLVAAVNWALGDIQMIGGSAGDDLRFEATALVHNGRTANNAAVLMLVETEIPFHAFKTQNFDPTPVKLVITAADAERRIVHEFNAEPAALEYANAIGLIPEDLGPFSFASHPLVVKVGSDYYCRSIRNMNPDGSLSFFCAIDVGLVLTVARPTDLAEATEATLSEVDKILSGTQMILGFDCILRRLDAENRQMGSRMEQIYRRHNVVGFHTYGEQYNAMHLNQTLTGIAFGAP